ncbi:hypothetical protein ABMA70_11950 [Halobacteriovorax sp. XZX-3]|uniref:hypothetical protein n=1 Tax=unclassified Halobacteriovorax TaxID=2639665 RepID=UPI003716BF8E
MKLLSLITLSLAFTASAHAAVNFKCSTMRKNIEFNLKGNQIQVEGRTPAQALIGRTHKVGNSVTKHYQLAGQKYQIHFDDVTNSNEMNTYISIRTKNGHEVTYPLSCNNI